MTFSQVTTGEAFDIGLLTETSDTFVFSQQPINQLSVLANSPGVDTILLLAGSDFAVDNEDSRNYAGFTGDDTILGGGGNDFLSGNDGNDILSGNQGADTLYGGPGQDVIYGGKESDVVNGDVGNDILVGDLGDDTLTGGAGNDTLTGGGGRDIFAVSSGEGLDQVTDFERGVDHIHLPEGVTFDNLSLTNLSSNQALISLASTNEQLVVLNGVAATDLSASDFMTGDDPHTHGGDSSGDHSSGDHSSGGQNSGGQSSEELVFSDGALKDPALGTRLFTEYEAFLSTEQEPEEPEGSTALGYGNLRFAKDLSFGEINVQVDNLEPGDIVGFHLHCGPPGFLGPIVINFGEYGEFSETFADGQFSARVTNENITFVETVDQAPSSLSPELPPPPTGVPEIPDGPPTLPEGCPVALGLATQQVNTVAGVEALARAGVLYFNVHTADHEFFGEVRGQVYPVES